jgi:hypothetical protein
MRIDAALSSAIIGFNKFDAGRGPILASPWGTELPVGILLPLR